MSWKAENLLQLNGELLWKRDIWDELLMPHQWMEIITLQHDGFTVEEMDAIAGGQYL